jgi:hypothetical protein
MLGFLAILGWPLIALSLLGRTRRLPNPWSLRVTFQVCKRWRELHADQEPGDANFPRIGRASGR